MKTRLMVSMFAVVAVLALTSMLVLSVRGSMVQAQQSSPPFLSAHWKGSETAAQSRASNAEFVSQVGGGVRTVVVSDTLAYVGQGSVLVVLDISDPTAPEVVGKTLPLTAFIDDVAVQENIVYAGAMDGLHLVDVSDPVNSNEIGFWETTGEARGVAVEGSYAYVICYSLTDNFIVVDISDPSNLSEVASYTIPWGGVNLVIEGNYAYVAAWDLYIMDISTPSNPIKVGSYASGYIIDVAVEGSYAHVVDQTGLGVIDISDPTNPSEVGCRDTSGWANSVAVAGSYAYVADGDGGLRVFDVSNPANPTEVGHAPMNAGNLVVAGNYAYVTSSGELRIIDASYPESPKEVSIYGALGPRQAYSIAVMGTIAYIADGAAGLRLMAVNNPINPIQVGLLDIGYGVGVTVTGSTAYVAAGFDGLYVVDVSDPANPREIGSYDTPGYAQDVVVVGTIAYVADGLNGLLLIDVSDPARLVEIGSYSPGEFAESVVVVGDYAYVAATLAGLRVVDVSNPANPSEVAYYDPGRVDGLDVVGNYAYLAASLDGLRVVDVSNPANPNEVGFYDTPGYANNVALTSDYAYVADGSAGVRVVDVRDPTQPAEAGFYVPGEVSDVFVVGNMVYVANSYGGLVILWFTSPTSSVISTVGGNLISLPDNTTYTFPAGIFTDTVVVTHTVCFPGNVPLASGNLVGIGHNFNVTAVYSSTRQSAQPAGSYTVTVQYNDGEKGPAIEDTLALYYWDGTQWIQEPSSLVDSNVNTLTATPDHFSRWARHGGSTCRWCCATTPDHDPGAGVGCGLPRCPLKRDGPSRPGPLTASVGGLRPSRANRTALACLSRSNEKEVILPSDTSSTDYGNYLMIVCIFDLKRSDFDES